MFSPARNAPDSQPGGSSLLVQLDDLARVALVVMKHVTSEHLLDLLARLHAEIARLIATEQGRSGLSSIRWYIEFVHPKLNRFDIIHRLSPVVGPEIAETMETYEEALERLYIEKFTRMAKDEGRKEGRQEGAQALLLRQLGQRFGTLPQAGVTRVTSAGREELERWGDRILDAASLDDVFAAP